MVSKKSQSLMINAGFLIAVVIGVINLLTYRELWILFAVVVVMVILIAFRMRENRKLKHRDTKN